MADPARHAQFPMSTLTYRFGRFQLDPAARALLRDGERVTLAPKALDCIVHLIDHRERAVGRDELIAAVWGKVDVSDGVLGQTILVARRALEDTGREQLVIRTVLRFGYQWVAQVEAVVTSAAPPLEVHAATPARAIVADSAHKRTRRRRLGAALVVVAIAGALLALALMNPRRPAAPAASVDRATPAATLVLPVEVAGDARSAWMRLGLMDLVAARLRATGHPVVPSDNVVALTRAYAQPTTNPAQLTALADAAAARVVIAARAEPLGAGWRVSLRSLRGADPPLAVHGDDGNALVAARTAADRLAMALGFAGSSGLTAPPPADIDALTQQVEAALLEERTDVAIALLDQAPAALRDQPQARFQRARAEFQRGRFDTAAALIGQVLAEVSAEADPVLRARALNARAGIALQRQHPAAAMPDLDRAIELLRDTQAWSALGTAYSNRAAAHGQQRDFGAAQADLAQARIALATAGDALGLAVVDLNAGTSALNRDRYAEAEPILASVAERFAGFHAWAAELNARGNLALARLGRLDPPAALTEAPRLRELATLVPDPERRRAAQLIVVQVLRANGQLHAASALLEAVRQQAQGAHDADALSRIAALDSQAAIESGRWLRAEQAAASVLARPPHPYDSREVARAWHTLVRARIGRSDLAAAATTLDRAQAWAQADGGTAARVLVGLAGAELAAAQGEVPAARAAFEGALEWAEEGHAPPDLLAASAAYVHWLLGMGDLARASVVAEGLATWTERDYDAAVVQLDVLQALGRKPTRPAFLDRVRELAGERQTPPNLARGPE